MVKVIRPFDMNIDNEETKTCENCGVEVNKEDEQEDTLGRILCKVCYYDLEDQA